MVDIVLPNMNGFELYWKIKRLNDKVKVWFRMASELYYEEIRKETIPKLDTSHLLKSLFQRGIDRGVKNMLGV
jgi:two-component SAPR family response regulator